MRARSSMTYEKLARARFERLEVVVHQLFGHGCMSPKLAEQLSRKEHSRYLFRTFWYIRFNLHIQPSNLELAVKSHFQYR